jgi:putrescine transport system substrate-binding protein
MKPRKTPALKPTAFRQWLIACSSLLLLSTAQAADDKVVNVYNWSDYIDEEILADFEKETGIKVVYDVFDSNDILETKLLAGSSGYDVVVPSAGFLTRQIEAGVFQELDKAKLDNYGNMWSVVNDQVARFGPLNDYSINYMWGTTGIGYVESKIQERLGDDAPVDSLAMFFDPVIASKLADCGIYALDASDEIIPAALAYIGEDPNTKDKTVIAKAEAVLMAVRPYIQKFHSSEYINALSNGDICLAVGWSGDIFQARDRADEADNGVSIVYSVPKEGALMWFDQMAIPKDAPHADNAHAFINYIMRPEVIAKATNYVWYANGNKASQPMLEEDLLSDTSVYPTEEMMKSMYIVTPYDPRTQRVVTRLWTKVKSGQ